MDDNATSLSHEIAGALRSLWVLIPAVCGAVVGLAAAPKLSWRGKIASVGSGAVSAVFIAPAFIDWIKMGWSALPPSFENFIIFFVGATAMGGIPLFLKWGYGIWGDPLGFLSKVRSGIPHKPEPIE